ncbi:MAG: response regulator [Pseudobdellovibrionaceae bacterium]
MKRPIIAIVDDEQDLRDNFQSLLEDQFEIKAFASPQEFLQALPDLQQKGLRLLVSDYKMPVMTGLEMVQKAHSQFPSLPFIILSGFLDKKTVLDAVKMGVFRLLEKPYAPEDLLAAIDQLLLESELQTVRNEIRQITSQLRELYSSIRLALLQHIPEELMDRLIVDAPDESEQKKMSFEDLLEQLEDRLELLLTSEKMISDIKTTRE